MLPAQQATFSTQAASRLWTVRVARCSFRKRYATKLSTSPASWFRKTRFTRGRVRELKNAHNSVTVQNRTHVYTNFFWSQRPRKSHPAVMSTSRETPCILHSVGNSLWNRLWTCRKTDYAMNERVLHKGIHHSSVVCIKHANCVWKTKSQACGRFKLNCITLNYKEPRWHGQVGKLQFICAAVHFGRFSNNSLNFMAHTERHLCRPPSYSLIQIQRRHNACQRTFNGNRPGSDDPDVEE